MQSSVNFGAKDHVGYGCEKFRVDIGYGVGGGDPYER